MADHTTVVNAPQGAETRPNLLRMLAPTIRDIAVPLAAYYFLHAAGYSDFSALLAGAVILPLTLRLPVVGLGTSGLCLAEPISNIVGGLACYITMLCTAYKQMGRE